MNPCPQCGAIPQATDKFCNICGTPVSPPGFGAQPGGGGGGGGGFPPPAPPAGGFGAPPPQGAYGAPPGGQAPMRCAMGHDIAPGASYCPHGHPLAMEQQMPYGAPQDQYGGGYGQQPGFGAPPPQQGFGAPPGFGQPPPYQDPNQAWGQPPPGFGAPPPQGGYGAPAPYGAPQPGFGAPPGFSAPPPQGGYGAPEPPPGVQPPPAALPPNALRGFLVSYQSNTQGDFWPLQGGRKTVGRANSGENVDIPLADATISSRHAAFSIDGTSGSILVEDTGSTNGTFVNEEHIGFNGKRELRDGDRIRFGGFTTTVKIVSRI